MNKKRFFNIIILIVVLLIYCYFVNKTGIGIPCLFHTIFKIKCPGCGITRMYINILNLEFKQAFLANPIIFCTQPFIYYELIKMLYCYIHEKKVNISKIENICLYILIVALIIFGILRNIVIQ